MEIEKIIELAIPYFEVMCPRVGGNEQIAERDNMLIEFIDDSHTIYCPAITYTYYPELSIVIYGMNIWETESSQYDLLKEFYLDCWKTALLDGARDYLRTKLQEEFPHRYISTSYGPGFQGVGMETLPEIMKMIDGKSIGLELYHGNLKPVKSCVGFYQVREEGKEVDEVDGKDCESCLSGGKNCIFCRGYYHVI